METLKLVISCKCLETSAASELRDYGLGRSILKPGFVCIPSQPLPVETKIKAS